MSTQNTHVKHIRKAHSTAQHIHERKISPAPCLTPLSVPSSPSVCRRVHMLQCSLAKPSHPMTKFRCGSLETLLNEPKTRGVDVRDR